MATFVVSSQLFLCFLLVCPVFSYIPAISFTRDKLLDIRKYTPPDISPVSVYFDVLLDIVVGRAAVLFRRFQDTQTGEASHRTREAQTAWIPDSTA